MLEAYYEILKRSSLNRNRCLDLKDISTLKRILSKYDEFIIKTLDSDEKFICFRTLVPIALDAIALGADPQEVSKFLNWKDFEELVYLFLSKAGLKVVKNVRYGPRRYEVDVIGIDLISKYALIIDCKHWMPGYRKKGKLIQAARNHRKRTEELSNMCTFVSNDIPEIFHVRYLLPIIVTLTETYKGVINGVFIVPIRTLRDFVINTSYYVDLLLGSNDVVLNKCFVK